MYWSKKLDLNEYLDVNNIDIEEKEHNIKMKYGNTLSEVAKLEYLKEGECIAIDRDTNMTYDEDYEVKRGLDLQLEKAVSAVIDLVTDAYIKDSQTSFLST